MTDGPFAETKELIAGFTMIQAKSKEDAIAWVKGWPREDGDVELEIRQLFEPEDFADLGKRLITQRSDHAHRRDRKTAR